MTSKKFNPDKFKKIREDINEEISKAREEARRKAEDRRAKDGSK